MIVSYVCDLYNATDCQWLLRIELAMHLPVGRQLVTVHLNKMLCS